MGCSNCGEEHTGEGTICSGCRTSLTGPCPTCGTQNPVRFNFCGNCGNRLRPETTEPVTATAELVAAGYGRRASDDASSAERRQLTVMFCDLVGSTALSLRLDPEELREVVRAYQVACAEAIERFGGYIAQYLGDGILAYFGYPVAHEDEGDRAVRAALAAIQAVEGLAAAMAIPGRAVLPPGIELAVRIGVHTGEVVIGEMGGGARRERLALGDAPNMAARLQALAAPNTVVISEDTRRLVDRTVRVEDMGMPALKGLASPLHVYRATGLRPAGDEDGLAGWTQFVGRRDELELLQDRWQRSQDGQGQAVVLVGDPGIGKSQLVREFVRRRDLRACNRLETRCLPYYRNTALFPFVDVLRRNLGCDPARPAHERLNAIAAMLERQGFPVEESVPVFASLMDIPMDGELAEPEESPTLVKERTHLALLQLIESSAAQAPLLMVIEDVHWADPSTIELLDAIVPLTARLPIFLLLTARHEFPMRWTEHAHVTWLAVRRLPDDQVEALVREITGGRSLPADVLAGIVARTDGVPLFVEELTRMVLESGILRETADAYVLDGPLPALAIPGTLRDSLEARLDRLATVKDVAQIAATIGREFDYGLLRAVAQLPEPRLRNALLQLEEAGLIFAEGLPPTAHYTFKHALVQEAAYQSLLRTTRQVHHLRIARALEKDLPETARSQPELLAQHYAAAGLAADAVEAWTKAGRMALRRSANAEAVAHLTQGLETVDRIADPVARANAEMDLLALYAPALVTTRGYAAPEVRAAYARARELALRSDRTRHICQVLAGLFAHHLVRGELDAAESDARELRELAGSVDDSGVQIVADAADGVIRFATGDVAGSLPLLEQVVASYDPALHGPMAFAFGHDFGVIGLAYSANALGLAGQLDRARDRAAEAVRTAEQLGHPHSLALALAMQAVLHQALYDVAVVRQTAARLLQLAQQQRFGHWEMQAFHFQSWVAASEQRFDEAFRLSASCAVAVRRLGTTLPQTFFQPTMVEVLLLAGRAQDALHAVDELMSILADRGIRWSLDSEMLRQRGDALLLLGRSEEAVASIQAAVQLAAQRGARLLELRAATDLAAALRTGGRSPDVNDMLGPRLISVRGGEDVADIIRARTLLETDIAAPV